MQSRNKDQQSSFSAFSSVDALVSKPVMGSDGAASWQEFRKNKGVVTSRGTAPHIPMKRADKLGTGFKSIDEERRHEELIREAGNDSKMYSGYTTFKRKHDQGEIEEKKRRKLIEDRIRPEKAKYFIAASTFEGWKEDYIFTTRDRGTGYYWDGMDSVKKLKGEDIGHNVASLINDDGTDGGAVSKTATDEAKVKKKKSKKDKKKKTSESLQSIESDEYNPMEQVLNAMRRRNEIINRPPGSNKISQETNFALVGAMPSSQFRNANDNHDDMETLAPQLAMFNWEVAKDPNTGKLYYFSRKTGERQWDNPLDKLKKSHIVEPTAEDLPLGWRSAQDSVGRIYYYHRESGKTSWERPTSEDVS